MIATLFEVTSLGFIPSLVISKLKQVHLKEKKKEKFERKIVAIGLTFRTYHVSFLKAKFNSIQLTLLSLLILLKFNKDKR